MTKAGYLNNKCSVGLFHFKNYKRDTIENVSLMFMWNFMYSNKFTGGIPTVKTFAYAYPGLMTVLAKMGLAQMSGANEILKIQNCKLNRTQ